MSSDQFEIEDRVEHCGRPRRDHADAEEVKEALDAARSAWKQRRHRGPIRNPRHFSETDADETDR